MFQHAANQICFDPTPNYHLVVSARLPDIQYEGERYEVNTVSANSWLLDIRNDRDIA